MSLRSEGVKGTISYANHMNLEAQLRSKLAKKGINPIDNYIKAIECLKISYDISKSMDLPYDAYLVDEEYLRIQLAKLGIDHTNNLNRTIEICKEVSKIKNIEKFPNYIISLGNEVSARSKLMDLDYNPEENLLEMSKLSGEYRNYQKPNTVKYGEWLLREGSLRISLATRGIDTIDNYDQAVKLLQRSREEGLEKGTTDYGDSLAYEAIANSKLEKDELNNLFQAIKLFEKARKEGLIKGTEDFGNTLWEEGNIYGTIAIKGNDTLDNYNQAVKLLQRSREEGLIKGTVNYLTSLCKEAQLRNKLAEHEIEVSDNLNMAIELLEQARKEGLVKGTEEFAGSLLEESISRQHLSKGKGIEGFSNLLIASMLLEQARKEGLREGTHVYAGSLLEEGNIKGSIALRGIDPVDNFKEAINLIKKSRKSFTEDSFSFALSLMNEGYNRQNISDFGIDQLNNLKKSIKLLDLAKNNGFHEGEDYYGDSEVQIGFSLYKLAGLRIDPINNLEKSIISFKNARNVGLSVGTPAYSRSFLYEQMAAVELSNFKNVGSKINILKHSIKIYHETRNSGFDIGTRDYGYSLLEEGKSRVLLSKLGINHKEELNKVLKLFKRARKEGLKVGTSVYSESLVEEGNGAILLAETEIPGPDTFFKLNNALTLFEEAKNSIDEKTYNYQIILMSEARARLKLAAINITPLENINKAIELFGFVKNNPLKHIPFSREFRAINSENEATARLMLVKKRIDVKENFSTVESLLLRAKNMFSKYDIVHLIGINVSLGNLMYSKKDFKKSYMYLKEAIRLTEEMRSSIKIPEIRKEYFENRIDAYSSMVFTCIALGKLREALKYSESARGRNFLELLSNEKKEIKGNPLYIDKYKEILSEIEDIEYQIFIKRKKEGYLSNKEIEEIDQLTRVLHDLKSKHDILLRKIKESDPEYYSLKSSRPIDPDQISILKGKTVVEYFIGSKLAIFVLNEDIHVKEIDINATEIKKKFDEFKSIIDKLEKNDSEFDSLIVAGEQILNYFYDLLIDPIKEYLTEELVIIPHRYLYNLPFQALKKDKYLIEDFKIALAYSISSLKFLNSKYGNGYLIVGNPTEDLESSEKEAIQIAEILKVSPIIRKDATKKRIKNEINDKEIIHLACHGYYDSFNPNFSGINLADGVLTTIDFMNFDMNAKLIVLSACETALGTINAGDEVEGLVRSIQYGGCRCALASLWKVDDKSTKELFIEFYTEGKFEDGIRNAELNLMKKCSFYHWAPFQIYGI